MRRGRHGRRSGPPPSHVDQVRVLLKTEADRHEPDRAALYRRVLEATSDDRVRTPGRSVVRGHGPRYGAAAPLRHRRPAITTPRVVAGATAAVVVGVAVATSALTVDDSKATLPATELPAATPSDSRPPPQASATGGVETGSPTTGLNPGDNPPVDPATQVSSGTGSTSAGAADQGESTPPAQPGYSGGEGASEGTEVSQAAPWSSQTQIDVTEQDALDWVLFGDGDEGVFARSAIRDPVIDINGPHRPDTASGFSNRFVWSSGTPVRRGSDHTERLLLGSRASVVLTVRGDPSRTQHLDLYLGSYTGVVRLEVGSGGERHETIVSLPAADVSRPAGGADGIVTVSFPPSTQRTRLRVKVFGDDADSGQTVTIAAALLR